MYDFMVFGYYAAAIGRAFFPTQNEYASLMLSLMTFGTGYLMRPLGAIVLGAYIDHHGRRKGLLLTLGLMAIGTLSIGCLPGYETIGLLAPLLVVAGRLVQGLSAGVEIGGVSVYLAEIATPGRKGFFVSWQSGSQQVAVICAAVIGLLLIKFINAFLLDPAPSMAGPANLYPPGYGYPLWVVYAVWVAVVALMYPICLWYARLKERRHDWWLSYL
jgi:MFS family permease